MLIAGKGHRGMMSSLKGCYLLWDKCERSLCSVVQTPSLLGWSDGSMLKHTRCSCRRPGLISQDPHCGSESSNTPLPPYMSCSSDLPGVRYVCGTDTDIEAKYSWQRTEINIRKQITRETTFFHFLNLSVCCYLFKHIHNLIKITEDLLLNISSLVRLEINFLK